MAVQDSNQNIILSSLANYQTVNMLELMSLAPGLDDEQIRQTLAGLEKNDLIKLNGAGDDQYVSLTSKGFDYLSSINKLAMVR